MDAEQEEYFNTSDEEDNVPVNPKESTVKPVNGGAPSPLLKPLVDYPDDDVMDVAGDEIAKKGDDLTETAEQSIEEASTSLTPGQQQLSIFDPVSPVTSPSPSTPKSAEEPLSSAPTPERLAEKRRREEEDDDELVKLSRNKRKSPTGGGFGQGVLNRKRSFGGSGSPPSKKIAINLAVKTTAATPTATTVEGEGEGEKKEV